MNGDDWEIFRKALDNLPPDIQKAKFEGAPISRKPGKTRPKPAHDMVLDLHGLNRAEALARLQAVLERTKGKHRRILVITGRGNRSEDGVGVLRDAVARFLENSGERLIREYGAAAPEFGGDGAFDILTK